MKHLFVLAVLGLSACAAVDAAPVGVGSGVTRSAVGPSTPTVVVPADPVAALSRLGQADSITTRQAAAMLGPPDVDRRDGVGALLTWRLESCALVLGFANDRLITTEHAARAQNESSPGLAHCVAQAVARRPSS